MPTEQCVQVRIIGEEIIGIIDHSNRRPGYLRVKAACTGAYVRGQTGVILQTTPLDKEGKYEDYVDINEAHILTIRYVPIRSTIYMNYRKQISSIVEPNNEQVREINGRGRISQA